MHFILFIKRSNALHLRFLVHNSNIFCICSYSLCICFLVMHTIMDASNNIKHISFLTKLKAELLEKIFKKPKIKKTFYPNEAQKPLLNICGFIDFLFI